MTEKIIEFVYHAEDPFNSRCTAVYTVEAYPQSLLSVPYSVKKGTDRIAEMKYSIEVGKGIENSVLNIPYSITGADSGGDGIRITRKNNGD